MITVRETNKNAKSITVNDIPSGTVFRGIVVSSAGLFSGKPGIWLRINIAEFHAPDAPVVVRLSPAHDSDSNDLLMHVGCRAVNAYEALDAELVIR